MDNAQMKADFNELYRRMNGVELREIDRNIYPVYTLCLLANADNPWTTFLHFW